MGGSLNYEPVIGFEVHAQLVTRTKLFCGCLNAVGGRPNSRTCPVCLGLPGALPVLNEAALDSALTVALALGAQVPERTGFARKNYFYPDLPKGYQITQFDHPLGRDGRFDVEVGGTVRSIRIRQVHLEEDAGKSVHASQAGRAVGLVDFNRCGVPLVEIVTRPDIRSVEEADTFLSALRRLLVYLGVATGRMHEGGLRFDTNVSLRPAGSDSLGTQTEIKNLNSFRAVRCALEYEIERQTSVLESGGSVSHETLLWDEDSGRALPMRSKELASDYRYFPEPDLVDHVIERGRLSSLLAAVPELPDAARSRLTREYGLPSYDASVITAEPVTLLFFELAVTASRDQLGEDATPGLSKTVANWMMGPLAAYIHRRGTTLVRLALARSGHGVVDVGAALCNLSKLFSDVVAARVTGGVSEAGGRRLLEEVLDTGRPAAEIIDALGLGRVADEDSLAAVVDEVLAEHSEEAARCGRGETKLLRFLMGQVMKCTEGRADPAVAARLLRDKLGLGGDR